MTHHIWQYARYVCMSVCVGPWEPFHCGICNRRALKKKELNERGKDRVCANTVNDKCWITVDELKRQITSRRATEVSFWFLNANLQMFVERLRVKKSPKCTQPTLIWEQRYFLFPLFLKLPSFPLERTHFTGTEGLSFAWVTFIPENLAYSKNLLFFLTRQLFCLVYQ